MTETYAYDAAGARVTRTSNGATIVTVADLWERTVGGATTHFYRFGADIIGVRRSDQGTRHLFSDHLGSVSAATTASGALVGMQHYDPWGRVRTGGIGLTARNFTGQRLDATGLLYYHARYYDPTLGRFISPDSLVPEPGAPQSLNRYAYVYNNPLKYVDPDGHAVFIPLLIVGGVIALKALDYGWTAWDAYQATRTLADPHASAADKAAAASSLALTAACEAAEPDDLLPIALPLDDLVRVGIIGSVKRAGDEAAGAVKPWEVGDYRDLERRSIRGDDLDIHHVPQKHPARQVIPGYDEDNAPAIAVPRGIHEKFLNPLNIKGPYHGTARALVDKGLRDLRAAGAPEQAIDRLQELIQRRYGQYLPQE